MIHLAKKKKGAKKRKGPLLVCQGYKPVGLLTGGKKSKSVKIGYIVPIRCKKVSRKKIANLRSKPRMTYAGRPKNPSEYFNREER